MKKGLFLIAIGMLSTATSFATGRVTCSGQTSGALNTFSFEVCKPFETDEACSDLEIKINGKTTTVVPREGVEMGRENKVFKLSANNSEGTMSYVYLEYKEKSKNNILEIFAKDRTYTFHDVTCQFDE